MSTSVSDIYYLTPVNAPYVSVGKWKSRAPVELDALVDARSHQFRLTDEITRLQVLLEETKVAQKRFETENAVLKAKLGLEGRTVCFEQHSSGEVRSVDGN